MLLCFPKKCQFKEGLLNLLWLYLGWTLYLKIWSLIVENGVVQFMQLTSPSVIRVVVGDCCGICQINWESCFL